MFGVSSLLHASLHWALDWCVHGYTITATEKFSPCVYISIGWPDRHRNKPNRMNMKKRIQLHLHWSWSHTWLCKTIWICRRQAHGRKMIGQKRALFKSYTPHCLFGCFYSAALINIFVSFTIDIVNEYLSNLSITHICTSINSLFFTFSISFCVVGTCTLLLYIAANWISKRDEYSNMG